MQYDSTKEFAKYVGTTQKNELRENATSWQIAIDGKMVNDWVG